LEFALAWSRQDAKWAEVERARRLGLRVNLEEDEEEEGAGPSEWRGSDAGQGCSTWAAKDVPPSYDDNGDGTEDYDIFYRRLSMH
jgi:hypothetical protein